MTFWRDNQTAAAACLLALLQKEGAKAYLPVQILQKKLSLKQTVLSGALFLLEQQGAVEQCVWPYQGTMVSHCRITGIGQAALQNYKEQWRREREELDRLLMGE